jgi:hypothetical protein
MMYATLCEQAIQVVDKTKPASSSIKAKGLCLPPFYNIVM